MTSKILIVDDEELARNRIKRFLGAGYEIHEATNGSECLSRLKTLTPDIMFLDIEMPGLNGFEVLQNIERRPFKLIFQTAYDEFALRAFDENACDYLLKPFDLERFNRALQRALARPPTDLQGLESQIGHLEKISVKQGATTRIVKVADIECFTSQDHYTFIHTNNAEFICDLSLSFLEARLDPKHFLRIHRNALIRLDLVQALHHRPRLEVELRGGKILPVARARRAQLKV